MQRGIKEIMKRKLSITLLMIWAIVMVCASALGEDARIFDRADLLTSSEEAEIGELIAQFQEDTGMDFVVVTSDTAHGDASQQTIADEFYDRGGFGLDEDNSGILYYIDMYERWHYLSTTGAMIDYMTDARIDSAIEQCKSYLSRAQYADAVSSMIALVRKNIQKGIPEGQYQYDVITGKHLTPRHKVLTSGELLVVLAAGLIAWLIFSLVVRGQYELKGQTYEYSFRENSKVAIIDRQDNYLRTTTTRTRKPDPPTNSGGGGGGFGGGSGVHTSSGGTSHGGGGGRF